MARDSSLFWWIAAAALLLGGGAIVYTQTKGLRLNNPGNLENDGTAWQGLASPQSDPTFYQFTSAAYGIRALRIDLTNAIDEGFNTLNLLIPHYAPPSENDVTSYVADVAARIGVGPDDVLDPTSIMPALVPAIIIHEQGLNPYDAATLQQGLTMA